MEVAERYVDGEATKAEFTGMRSVAASARNWTQETPEFYPAWLAHVVTAEETSSIIAVVNRRTELSHLVPATDQVDLFRDIIGNPWRGVTLPTVAPRKQLFKCPHCRNFGHYCSFCCGTKQIEAVCGECFDKGVIWIGMDNLKWIPCAKCPKPVCPWLTPTVVSLATAAYQERATRLSYEPPPDLHPEEEWYHPHKVYTGRLDNSRLAVLADALSDGGCKDEVILSHLRSDGVHVRGCWALDLLLSKE